MECETDVITMDMIESEYYGRRGGELTLIVFNIETTLKNVDSASTLHQHCFKVSLCSLDTALCNKLIWVTSSSQGPNKISSDENR